MSDEESVGSESVGSQSATCVESEPSQPEERHAHEHERYVVRHDGVSLAPVVALAYHEAHDECRYAGVDVHHGASGKVDGSHLLQKSAAPHPVSHRQIGYDDPQNDEHHVALELDSFGKCSENERRGDECEHALEHGECHFGYARRHYAVCRYAVHERLVQSAHEEPQP